METWQRAAETIRRHKPFSVKVRILIHLIPSILYLPLNLSPFLIPPFFSPKKRFPYFLGLSCSVEIILGVGREQAATFVPQCEGGFISPKHTHAPLSPHTTPRNLLANLAEQSPPPPKIPNTTHWVPHSLKMSEVC